MILANLIILNKQVTQLFFLCNDFNNMCVTRKNNHQHHINQLQI